MDAVTNIGISRDAEADDLRLRALMRSAQEGDRVAYAAAASILTLVHPFDATALDLGVHFIAVGLVVTTNGFLSRRLAVRSSPL